MVHVLQLFLDGLVFTKTLSGVNTTADIQVENCVTACDNIKVEHTADYNIDQSCCTVAFGNDIAVG